MKKALSFLMALLLLVAIVPALAPVPAASAPPKDAGPETLGISWEPWWPGNIHVFDDGNVTVYSTDKTFENCTFLINGNVTIIVEGGADLTLRNVDIILNGTATDPFYYAYFLFNATNAWDIYFYNVTLVKHQPNDEIFEFEILIGGNCWFYGDPFTILAEAGSDLIKGVGDGWYRIYDSTWDDPYLDIFLNETCWMSFYDCPYIHINYGEFYYETSLYMTGTNMTTETWLEMYEFSEVRVRYGSNVTEIDAYDLSYVQIDNGANVTHLWVFPMFAEANIVNMTSETWMSEAGIDVLSGACPTVNIYGDAAVGNFYVYSFGSNLTFTNCPYVDLLYVSYGGNYYLYGSYIDTFYVLDDYETYIEMQSSGVFDLLTLHEGAMTTLFMNNSWADDWIWLRGNSNITAYDCFIFDLDLTGMPAYGWLYGCSFFLIFTDGTSVAYMYDNSFIFLVLQLGMSNITVPANEALYITGIYMTRGTVHMVLEENATLYGKDLWGYVPYLPSYFALWDIYSIEEYFVMADGSKIIRDFYVWSLYPNLTAIPNAAFYVNCSGTLLNYATDETGETIISVTWLPDNKTNYCTIWGEMGDLKTDTDFILLSSGCFFNLVYKDEIPPRFVSVSAPKKVDLGATVTFEAEVEDPSGIASVTLYYSTDGVTWNTVEMTYDETTGKYTAEITAPSTEGHIFWYIKAVDTWGNEAESPVKVITVTTLPTPISILALLAGLLAVPAIIRRKK